MTQREVQIALQNIDLRNYNDMALNARMRGHKIQLKDHSFYKPKDGGRRKNPSLSAKEQDALKKHMDNVLKRRGLKPRNGNQPRCKP